MVYGEVASAGPLGQDGGRRTGRGSRFCLKADEESPNGCPRQALIIEKHYGRPDGIRVAKDGDDNQPANIVQAVPKTVKAAITSNVMERLNCFKEKGEEFW